MNFQLISQHVCLTARLSDLTVCIDLITFAPSIILYGKLSNGKLLSG